ATGAVITTISRHAQTRRASGFQRRSSETTANRLAAPERIRALSVIVIAVAASSTRPNVVTFAHISAAPAAAASVPRPDSTATLHHAGEKTSRANNWRRTSST